MAPSHSPYLSFDLTPGAWAHTISAAAILTYVLSSILAWWRLRHFNGPLLASFSHLWLLRACNSGRMGEWWAETEARYGSGGPSSTVRIGPNELLASDLDVIRRMGAARGKYARSTWYRVQKVDPYADAMLNTLDTALHDRIKAQTAPGYAGRDNDQLEADLDAVLAQVVERIRTNYAVGPSDKKGEETKPLLDWALMAQYFTLDSISKLAFGEEFGMVREERDVHGHIDMLHGMAKPIILISAVPWLRAIFTSDIVLRLIGPKPTDKKGVGRMMGFGRSLVGKRFAAEKDHKDMLGSFIRHGLTQRECEVEALIQIIAGSDTTATTLRAGMLYLLSAPRAYRALQAEIDEGIETGRISSPITNAEANELPYLQGVILESLRLHPPFTGIPFKVVPPEGDTIDGKHVPGGTLITPNHATTGRNRDVFGADAGVFHPERWIETQEDREQRAEMRRVTELAFGYGRWGCAGRMIAFLELNKVFVELLRRFDFQLVNPAKPWKSVNFNIFLQSDMWVSVSMREGAE